LGEEEAAILQHTEQLRSGIAEMLWDEALAPLEAYGTLVYDLQNEAQGEGSGAESREDEGIGEMNDLADLNADDIIRIYFHEMTREPLLSSEDESELAQRIERGHVAKQTLIAQELSTNERRRLQKLVQDAEEAEARFI
jgi:DNA-directed RNA polymerase sigma subunit (sigma70/sigma32)